VSEELENSLQQAIETYLNDRLRSIDEQVSRLQTEVNEALAQLRESSNAQSLEGTALSAAIFAHLQTARGQKLTGATVSAPPPQDAAKIKRAVSDIEAQRTQTEILKSLLKGAVHFAERVALFVIKNDQAIGWRVCEVTEPTNLELIGGVSIPLSAETILTRAVRARSTWSGDPRASSEDQMLIDQLGGSPQMIFSIPLTVRGKVVAVLNADSTSSDTDAINLDALEILVRVAAMAVNLVSVHRAGPEARPETTAVRTEPAADRPAEVESTYAPQVEAQVAEPESQPAPVEAAEVSAPVEVTPEEIPVEAAAEEPPEQLEAEPAAAVEPSATQAPPEPETIRKPADSVWSESVVQSSTPPPAFVSEYAAPLGSTRRFGVSEPDLPIEVSEEERRLHNDARRFARLLVSEIKLYNEPKVKEGRSHGDLYDRLREDIDRSRQMYDKRVAPPVAARHDYFHQELVNMLAEGDPAKLGVSYPGAVSAN
jgi:hypothetical protein